MFLEERISVQLRYDNTYSDGYEVEKTVTSGDYNNAPSSYAFLKHPYPIREFYFSYQLDRDEMFDEIISLYHRVYGTFAGFRAKHFDDFSTSSNNRGAPNAIDQELLLVSSGVYQLQKRYGADKPGLPIGYPMRTIFKPVSGTVKAAINGTPTTAFTVNYTSGLITFNTPPALNAVVTGGCEFDFPVEFIDKPSIVQNHPTSRYVSFSLREIINKNRL